MLAFVSNGFLNSELIRPRRESSYVVRSEVRWIRVDNDIDTDQCSVHRLDTVERSWLQARSTQLAHRQTYWDCEFKIVT